MKKVILLITLFTGAVGYTYSQNIEIENLKAQKEKLISKIIVLQDSLANIKKTINSLALKDTIKTGEVLSRVYTLRQTDILDKPVWGANVIVTFPKYKYVNVYSFHDGYWLIKEDSIKGYVEPSYIGELDPMRAIRKKHDQTELEKEYDEITAMKIANRQIWIGMTTGMARKSLGNPKDINRSTGSYGTHEQWVYDNRYLYFENGKLTSFQD